MFGKSFAGIVVMGTWDGNGRGQYRSANTVYTRLRIHYNKRLVKIPKKGVPFMAEEGIIYVCALCGQEVRVVKSGAGTLVCCDQPMQPKED